MKRFVYLVNSSDLEFLESVQEHMDFQNEDLRLVVTPYISKGKVFEYDEEERVTIEVDYKNYVFKN